MASPQAEDLDTRLAMIATQAKRVRRESSVLVQMVARARESAAAAETETAEEAHSHGNAEAD